jgi:hypothetical protein
MAKQVTLTTPEARPDLTCQCPRNVHVDLVSGVVNMALDKCDDAGNVSGTVGVQWTLSPTDLASLIETLVGQGQTAGQIPAGTVEDV